MKGFIYFLSGEWFADLVSRRRTRVMQFGKLTWVGLMIVALGWTLLISGFSLADLVNKITGRASPAVVALNMGIVAQSTILTGLGLAILGMLQTGFGALNRFFDSVLERTAKKPETGTAAYRQEPVMSHGAPARVDPKARTVVERGLIKNRAYKRFGDGSIEVETLLGLRRFRSMREAADFVG